MENAIQRQLEPHWNRVVRRAQAHFRLLENSAGRTDGVSPQIQLQWFAPFFSGGGYSSEAISYVSELQKWLPVGIVQVPKP
jgi:hypothetical protein